MCSGTSKYCLKRTTASSIADQSQFLLLSSGGSWHYTGRMLYDSFFRTTGCTSTLPVASAGTRHAGAVVCVCLIRTQFVSRRNRTSFAICWSLFTFPLPSSLSGPALASEGCAFPLRAPQNVPKAQPISQEDTEPGVLFSEHRGGRWNKFYSRT